MMNTQKHNRKGVQPGFSILETLLASFVLVVGLVAAVQIFAPIMQTMGLTRDRIVAVGLAQEGVELVKNVRDHNMLLSGQDFTARGIGGATYCIDTYSFTDNSNVTASCGSGALQLQNKRYVHSAGTSTGFRRYIRTDSSVNDSLHVVSFVTWDDTAIPNNINVCTLKNQCAFTQITLTDWY